MALLRKLTTLEIVQLESQGCTAENWSFIRVRDRFSADGIINVQFSGEIEIGCLNGVFTLVGGLQKPCGIYDSILHDCVIGDHCRISDATIAKYVIGDDCQVEEVGGIYTDQLTSFGNGVEVAVLNEIGGREVTLYDGLSAQTAYVQAFYRHRPELIHKIKALIVDYKDKVTSDKGTIGDGTRIVRCRLLKNIRVGASAVLAGAVRLENGTILSSPEAPTRISDGVIANDFIVAEGAHVRSGTMITNVFVGQAAHLARRFSANQSLFFSYCHVEHGEACSVFAGPFTVSHHKSTLLIGGYFSFMNAGSGTNQSNHLYRLGPAHQGVLERGCKTGSDSYLLWPSRVGAFSLIVGKHTHHVDTADLPFSYLIENKQETYLVPGASLSNVGTIRDAQKWQARSTLKENVRTDLINCELFTPYTVGKILRAVNLLKDLKNKPSDLYHYNGTRIKASALNKGIALYENAIQKYLGDSLIKRLAGVEFNSFQEVKQLLNPRSDEGLGKWIDMAGMVAPKEKTDQILSQIEVGEITQLEEIEQAWSLLHNQYNDLSWNWAADLIEQHLGKKILVWTCEDLIQIMEQCLVAILDYDHQLIEDARKEFAPEIAFSYGIDDDEAKAIDFDMVRGRFEEHPVVISLREHAELKKQLAEAIIYKLKAIN